jgi:hypothetical protein
LSRGSRVEDSAPGNNCQRFSRSVLQWCDEPLQSAPV